MSSQLHIDQLTLAEKLQIMEELWADLSARADGVPIPQWHKDVLDAREQLIESGKAHFDDWETVKERIITETS